jgi:hypothetical protein
LARTDVFYQQVLMYAIRILRALLNFLMRNILRRDRVVAWNLIAANVFL